MDIALGYMVNFLNGHAPFIFILGLVGLILYKANNDDASKFQVYQLISDTAGRASLEKVASLTGYLAITWAFMDMAAARRLTVEEIGIYGAIVILSRSTTKFIDAKYSVKDEVK